MLEHVRFAADGRNRLYKSVREESHPDPHYLARPVPAALAVEYRMRPAEGGDSLLFSLAPTNRAGVCG